MTVNLHGVFSPQTPSIEDTATLVNELRRRIHDTTSLGDNDEAWRTLGYVEAGLWKIELALGRIASQ